MSKDIRKLLSGVIIAKDNEATIGETIASLKPYCGTIVVADTGSSDRTPQIATLLGASVFFTSWNNDFSEARNFALSHVTSPWVISIDTDEALSKFDPEKFLQIISDINIGGVNLLIRNLLPDGLESKHRYTRIFRNERNIRFEGKIHEQINNSIINAGFSIIETDFEIYHTGYANQKADKHERNIELLSEELTANPDDDFTLYHLAQSYFSAKDNNKAKELFIKLTDSEQLSQIQRDNVAMRLAQIALDENDFSSVLSLTEKVSGDSDIAGLQIFIKALAYFYLRDFTKFTKNIADNRVDKSNLVNKENLGLLRQIGAKHAL